MTQQHERPEGWVRRISIFSQKFLTPEEKQHRAVFKDAIARYMANGGQIGSERSLRQNIIANISRTTHERRNSSLIAIDLRVSHREVLHELQAMAAEGVVLLVRHNKKNDSSVWQLVSNKPVAAPSIKNLSLITCGISADSRKQQILVTLSSRNLTYSEIMKITGLSNSSVGKYIRELRNAGYVQAEKVNGGWVCGLVNRSAANQESQ